MASSQEPQPLPNPSGVGPLASPAPAHVSPDLPPHYCDQSRQGSIGDEGRNQPQGNLSSQSGQTVARDAVSPESTQDSMPPSGRLSRTSFQEKPTTSKDFERFCSGPTSDGSSVSQEDEIPHHVFGKSMKWIVIVIVSAAATLSGFSTNAFFPAQEDIANGLGITAQTVNLSITTYIIAQGIAPSFWGPLADFAGRRTILLLSLIIYALANVGLALTNGPAMLLAFRAIQAIGSSSTIALGAGVIADITTPAERGGYLGLFSGMRQMSMAFGPVIGGLLAGGLGWRAIFWFLLALSGATILLISLILPETLRRIAGNGSTPLTNFYHRPLLYSCLPLGRISKADATDPERAAIVAASHDEIKPRPAFHPRIFIQPLKCLFEKDVACALFFGACVYTVWSMMVATTTVLFKDIFGFTTIEVGLAFLANGFGCMFGSIISGKTLNKTFTREARLFQHSKYLPPTTPLPKAPLPLGFPLERARLGDASMYSAVMIVALLIYGWSLTSFDRSMPVSTHWIAPLLAQFLIGYCNTAVLNSNNTLVVDLYPGRSASASAVINLSRSAFAAAGVAVVDIMLEAMNPGWLTVVLAGIVLIGMVPYGLHVKYGGLWRRQREERNGSVVVSPM